MKQRNTHIYVGDFETTVYDGQQDTEVWASGLVKLWTEDVEIHSSIAEQWKSIKKRGHNMIIYYHNLKFDGEFWLYYLMAVEGFKQAYTFDENGHLTWKKRKDMKSGELMYSISAMGQWYSITIKYGKQIIELRDSLKLLPFSLKVIGKSFKTKHQKLEMEYKGFRYAGGDISEDERKYLTNDLLVIKEALEIMFEEGHDKLTIGSCCMSEYKNIFGKKNFEIYFPQLTNDQDAFIRRAYKGGWCYVVEGKDSKKFINGCTLDVNSLYPSMMHSESGNRYPIGHPHYFKGGISPDLWKDDIYFFVHIRTRFYIKDGYLPFIQIKNSYKYRSTECLKTSDVYDKRTKKYYPSYIDIHGNEIQAIADLTLTKTDYILMLEHYNLKDTEIIDGYYFQTDIGLFDEYIDKYKAIKTTSTGARRTLAKLFLNNLYGKFATGTDSSFKVASIGEMGDVEYNIVAEKNKDAVYIPVGAAITSYARNFTIRAAQANYYGENKPGFIYADTDSIHCDLPIDKIKNCRLHPTDFCAWKHETDWKTGWFVRQKTYIEEVVREDGIDCDPYYNIKCAGMPQKCKDLLIMSFTGEYDTSELTEEEAYFVSKKRDIEDFKIGIKVPGKLRPKHIRGGVLLVDTDFTMR